MAFKTWLRGGKWLRDSRGRLIWCESCPCGGTGTGTGTGSTSCCQIDSVGALGTGTGNYHYLYLTITSVSGVTCSCLSGVTLPMIGRPDDINLRSRFTTYPIGGGTGSLPCPTIPACSGGSHSLLVVNLDVNYDTALSRCVTNLSNLSFQTWNNPTGPACAGATGYTVTNLSFGSVTLDSCEPFQVSGTFANDPDDPPCSGTFTITE